MTENACAQCADPTLKGLHTCGEDRLPGEMNEVSNGVLFLRLGDPLSGRGWSDVITHLSIDYESVQSLDELGSWLINTVQPRLQRVTVPAIILRHVPEPAQVPIVGPEIDKLAEAFAQANARGFRLISGTHEHANLVSRMEDAFKAGYVACQKERESAKVGGDVVGIGGACGPAR